MSEYIIELPDSGAADEFIAKMGVEDCRIYGYWLTGEIVRCRDCKLCDERYGRMLCRRDMSCDEIALDVEPDGFCAWGERREQ